MRLYSFSFCAKFLFVLCCVSYAETFPHIFTDSYGQCEYQITGGKKPKKLSFSDKLWVINSGQYDLYFSVCKSLQNQCRNKTSSCIAKRNGQFIDLGNEFVIVETDPLIFESSNGDRCPNSNRNYSLKINFECSNTMKLKPRLWDEDECRFEVQMMRPDCKPKCTDLIEGAYLLDVRNFPKNLQVESDSKKFSISLCGSNKNCDSDISSCEILDNSVVPLASIESQSLNYDISKNELTARGRYKQGRTVRDVQVLIRCNWTTELANARYKKVQIQGKHYRFELESWYGCVKLPHKCEFTSKENLHYNLSGLHQLNGWRVSGVPQGSIMLNVCGPLKQTYSICSDQHSQICHFNNDEIYNRGSILSSLEATTGSDLVKAVFVSGSTCKTNNSFLYTTQIEFKCSKTEKGPTFKKYEECVMILTWETPHACPVDIHTGQDCLMNDKLGSHNLQKLHTETDRVHALSPNNDTQLVYNLCGPIHRDCNNFSNVSFCLTTRQQDTVVAWENRDLIGSNGLLMMELNGGQCSNQRSHGAVHISFICCYEELLPPSQISVIEDGCKFNLTIFTPHACLSDNIFNDCTASSGSLSYDLSALSQKSQNYIIRSDENLDFIFNLCGPVINGPGVSCRSNTMVCLRNNTEPNIKKRFTSVGSVGGPQIVNNELIVEATMGTYCEGFGHYRSVFHFECSLTKSSPMISSVEPCVYHFLWKTPEACPRNCEIRSSNSDLTLDITKLEEKVLKIQVDNGTTYSFHLCQNYYRKIFSDSSTNLPLTRDLAVQNHTIYIKLDLARDCRSSNVISKLVIETECHEKSFAGFEQKTLENCTLKLLLRTNVVCSITEPKVISPSHVTTTSSTEKQKLLPVNNCTFVSDTEGTGLEFELNKLKSSQVMVKNNKYSFNFDGRLKNCNGILCKNDINILPVEVCPVNSFNKTSRYLRLIYRSLVQCKLNGLYEVEVVVKCNQSRFEQHIHENGECKITTEYTSPEACYLFSEVQLATVETPFPVAATVGSIVGLLFVIAGVTIIYMNRRRFLYINIPLLQSSKEAVPVYIRNFTE